MRQILINLKLHCTCVQTWNILKDITNSNEQSPSRDLIAPKLAKKSPPPSPILWHQDFHYRMNRPRHLSPFLSQINPVHIVPSYFCKGQFNIIHSSMSGFSMRSLSFSLTEQIPVCISLLRISATCSVHLYVLDLTTIIIFAEDWKAWSFSIESFPSLLCNTSWRLILWWWGIVSSWPSNEAGGPYATT